MYTTHNGPLMDVPLVVPVFVSRERVAMLLVNLSQLGEMKILQRPKWGGSQCSQDQDFEEESKIMTYS